jgi:hypothetical protein
MPAKWSREITRCRAAAAADYEVAWSVAECSVWLTSAIVLGSAQCLRSQGVLQVLPRDHDCISGSLAQIVLSGHRTLAQHAGSRKATLSRASSPCWKSSLAEVAMLLNVNWRDCFGTKWARLAPRSTRPPNAFLNTESSYGRSSEDNGTTPSRVSAGRDKPLKMRAVNPSLGFCGAAIPAPRTLQNRDRIF